MILDQETTDMFAGRHATAEQHLQTSDSLRQAAERSLATGDLALASEAFWGITAHMLQGVAENHGMKHNSNLDFRVIKDWLVAKTQIVELDEWFERAYRLHQNFYRIVMSRADIQSWSKYAIYIADAARPFAQA